MRKYQIFFTALFLAFLAPLAVSAQPELPVSSTREEIQRRIDCLFDSAFNTIEVDNVQALRLSRAGFSLSQAILDTTRLTKMGMLFGSSLRRLHRVDSALAVYDAVIPMARTLCLQRELAILLASRGVTLILVGKYDQALRSLYESLAMRAQMNDSTGHRIVLLNIGMVHYKLQNYAKALDVFRGLSEGSHPDDEMYGDLLNLNIAHCYAYLDSIPAAEAFLEKGLIRCKAGCREEVQMSATYVAGVIALKRGDPVGAKISFRRSCHLAFSLKDVRFQLDNLEQLIAICLAEGKKQEARSYLLEASDVLKGGQSFMLERMKIYFRFAEFHATLGSYKDAHEYLHRYIGLRDSVYSADLRKNLADTEAEFQERENNLRIENQAQLISLNQSIVKAEKDINMVISLLLFLSLVVLVLLFLNIRSRARIATLLGNRLAERTHELGSREMEFVRTFLEREAGISRVADELTQLASRIKGLGIAGRQELTNDQVYSYFSRIEEVGDQLSVIVKRRLLGSRVSSTKGEMKNRSIDDS